MVSINRFIGLICFIGSIGYAKIRYSVVRTSKFIQLIKQIKPIQPIQLKIILEPEIFHTNPELHWPPGPESENFRCLTWPHP